MQQTIPRWHISHKETLWNSYWFRVESCDRYYYRTGKSRNNVNKLHSWKDGFNNITTFLWLWNNFGNLKFTTSIYNAIIAICFPSNKIFFAIAIFSAILAFTTSIFDQLLQNIFHPNICFLACLKKICNLHFKKQLLQDVFHNVAIF